MNIQHLMQKILNWAKGNAKVLVVQQKEKGSRGNGGKTQRDAIQRWWWN